MTLAEVSDKMLNAIQDVDSGNVWNPGGVPIGVSATISVGGIVVR